MKGDKSKIRHRRIREILDIIIQDSFASLKQVRIDIVKSADDDEFLACSGNRGVGFKIYASKSIDKINDFALTGIVAHELCHIETINRWPPALAVLEVFASNLLPFLNGFMERRTDENVIQKGYGENLLAFQKYHDKRYEAYTWFDGLKRQ